MAHLNFLEQFETNDGAAPVKPPIQDLPGYDAGYEAGLVDSALQNRQLSKVLVDRIVEMRFGYAEAQQAMMQALRPFVSALANQVLPALLDDLTRAHVTEALLEAAQADVTSPIKLTFHPDTAELIKDVLSDITDANVTLFADRSLGPQEVYVGHSGAETQLDVAGLIAGVQAALSNISAPLSEVEKNG